MKKRDSLDRDTFETLLKWLAHDRESAGEKYEQIRHSLIQILNWNGAINAEDLADKTINRVANKLPEIAKKYQGDPALYFYGVAKNLLRQQQKREQQLSLQDLDFPSLEDREEGVSDAVYECLERCLAYLPAFDREVVTEYYEGETSSKIKLRKELAQRLKIEPNALRVKIHRIRVSLEKCLEDCLAKSKADE